MRSPILLLIRDDTPIATFHYDLLLEQPPQFLAQSKHMPVHCIPYMAPPIKPINQIQYPLPHYNIVPPSGCNQWPHHAIPLLLDCSPLCMPLPHNPSSPSFPPLHLFFPCVLPAILLSLSIFPSLILTPSPEWLLSVVPALLPSAVAVRAIIIPSGITPVCCQAPQWRPRRDTLLSIMPSRLTSDPRENQQLRSSSTQHQA